MNSGFTVRDTSTSTGTEVLEFADEPTSIGTDHVTWAGAHEHKPIWLAEVDLADSPRLIGAYVTPAARVLGLRAWDDADDGAAPVPWSLFDVEKLVRMALHQSGLAFEALVSARTWGSFPARELASATVTSGVLHYYRDLTLPRDDFEPWRWRTLLTGALLARDGLVSQSLPTLCAALAVSPSYDDAQADRLRRLLGETRLPDKPADYDFANDLVVALRLEAE